MSGRPTAVPYESFPDVIIRRGRRKDVALTSRPSQSYRSCLQTPGRKSTSEKLLYGPKGGGPLNVTPECDILWTTLAEWVMTINIILFSFDTLIYCKANLINIYQIRIKF